MLRTLALLTLVGCYSPAYQDCAISCAVSGVCPSGLDCVAGVCRSMTGACGGGGDGRIGDGQQFGAWQFRKSVTFARGPAEMVANFPLLVHTAADSDLANFAQDDGGDIRFATADGIGLAHELERFDEATGELFAWVNVPALAAQGPTTFFMYYGNAAAPDQQSPLAVWDADYIGVWHLSDPPGQAVNDSSPNAAEGTKLSGNTPAPIATGKVAGGFVFSGGANELFSLGNDPAKLVATDYTFETWLNRNPGASNSERRLLAFPTAFSIDPVVAYSDEAAGATPESVFVQLDTVRLQGPASVLPASTWVHLAIVFQSATSSVSFYINGMTHPTSFMQFPFGHDNVTLTIGGAETASALSVFGLMDEVRLSRVARSASYVAASYLSQDSDSVTVFGQAETAP